MPLKATLFLCEHQAWEVSWSGITSQLCHLCHETPKTLTGPNHTHGRNKEEDPSFGGIFAIWKLVNLLQALHQLSSSLISFFHT